MYLPIIPELCPSARKVQLFRILCRIFAAPLLLPPFNPSSFISSLFFYFICSHFLPSFHICRLGYSRGDSHKACPTVGGSKRGGVSVDPPSGSAGLQPEPGEQTHSQFHREHHPFLALFPGLPGFRSSVFGLHSV